MKIGISAELKAHYASSTTTVTMCWRVELQSGTVLGFTAFDEDIEFDGVTYEARSGLMSGAGESQSRLAADNTEITGVLDSEAISVDDLTAGLWDYAAVRVFNINWADTSMGADILISGRLGEVTIERNVCRAELRGLAATYAPPIGEVYQIACRASLGDARCTVDLLSTDPLDSDGFAFTSTGVVDSVSESGLVLYDATRTEPGPGGGLTITAITKATRAVVTSAAHGLAVGQIVYVAGVEGMVQINGQFYVVYAITINTVTLTVDSTEFDTYTGAGTVTPQGDAGYWDYGKITMTTGASAGLSMEIKAYSLGTITLQLQLPRGVEAGDEYEIQVGCGKRFLEDCVQRFNNGINFRGEPHLPGIDQVLRVGGQ
jgi:uncharacterized phage protein (TIGR02218 family)